MVKKRKKSGRINRFDALFMCVSMLFNSNISKFLGNITANSTPLSAFAEDHGFTRGAPFYP